MPVRKRKSPSPKKRKSPSPKKKSASRGKVYSPRNPGILVKKHCSRYTKEQCHESPRDKVCAWGKAGGASVDRCYSKSKMSSARRNRSPRKLSAYNIFVQKEIPKLVKKHPRMSPKSRMREVGALWRKKSKK